jgi:hypothetical protein
MRNVNINGKLRKVKGFWGKWWKAVRATRLIALI